MRKKTNEQIVTKIVEGIQEKKGKKIIVVDMQKLKEAPCSFFVICEGDSNIHVNAIATSVKDYLSEKASTKPFATAGFENAEWIALDYGLAIVHVFQRHKRAFYDIEHLWADADLKTYDDIN